MDLTIYEIDERITIWEGVALILDIDPTWLSRERTDSYKPYTFHSANRQDDFRYQKLVKNLLQHLTESAPTGFDVQELHNPYPTHDNPQINEILTFNRTPEPCYVCQTSSVLITALKDWAIAKGFKSEFLCNVNTDKEEKENALIYDFYPSIDTAKGDNEIYIVPILKDYIYEYKAKPTASVLWNLIINDEKLKRDFAVNGKGTKANIKELGNVNGTYEIKNLRDSLNRWKNKT